MNTKRSFLFIVFVTLLLCLLPTGQALAAPINHFPVTVTQPDGTELKLYASGDEFYNWLEDARYFTVIQDKTTGFYTYAQISNGEVVASPYVVGKIDPRQAGLRARLNISPEKREAIRDQALLTLQQQMGPSSDISNLPPTNGSFNNLVMFIRFAGEAEFTNPLSSYSGMLTDTGVGAKSLASYFSEVSYGRLTINSLFVPSMTGSVISYQDSHPRGYFQPYDASTNAIGYVNSTDRQVREWQLLRDAINANLANFPTGPVMDADNDGYIDEMSFIVRGSPTAWSTLLWPHAWGLYDSPPVINGKTVRGYNFELDGVLNPTVLEHETFHVLGSPDLYHYSSDGLAPVASWDLMESGSAHMGCYMKYKYGQWIDTIPTLSGPGVYSLNPLTSPTNNCVKIASPNSSSEFFVLEYRSKTGTFESSLPGSGLLVYRINPAVSAGNRNGPPDEVYIYRPGGTISTNGSPDSAFFSKQSGRKFINDNTDPSSFLTSGGPGGLNICSVGAPGATISFEICGGSMISISGSVGVEGAAISYLRNGQLDTVLSGASGTYSLYVPAGWSGSLIPSKPGYTFSPASRDISAIASAQTGQDFSPTAPSNLILDPGVEAPTGIWGASPWVNYNLCQTSVCGNYPNSIMPRTGTGWIVLGWGDKASSAWQTVTIPSASKASLSFYLLNVYNTGALATDDLRVKIDNDVVFSTYPGAGPTRSYYQVSVDISAYANGQAHIITFEAVNNGEIVVYNIDDLNLTVIQSANISGTSGQAGVTLHYVNGDETSLASDAQGAYTLPLYPGWAGFVVPELSGYTFAPVFKSYTNLLSDLVAENFLAIPNATATFTPTATYTFTPVPPTATATFTALPPTSTNTFTPVPPTATKTFTPVPPTSTNTFTPVPPTATHTFTPVPPTATHTFTPVPPTATKTFTAVPPTSTHTFTPVPPTSTNTFTPVPPTATKTFTAVPPTSTHTFTPVPPTSTNTFTPVPPTSTNTFTPVPPTATKTFTAVPPTATKTYTAVPPTATKTFTAVPPTATKTFTPVPPTVTKTATKPAATATKTATKPAATATKTPTKPAATATKTATPGAAVNLLKDPGFELYPNNINWGQTSTNSDTPLCNITDCGSFGTAKPRTGKAWAWFGGVTAPSEVATLSQSVVIPKGTAKLDFYFWVGSAGAGSDARDVFTVTVDGKTVWSANATQKATYNAYKLVTIDLGSYANGLSHKISFNCSITTQNVTFNLDDVNLHK